MSRSEVIVVSPVERAVTYLRTRLEAGHPEVLIGIEPRPAAHRGLHVRVLRTGGGERTDFPFVPYLLTLDVSHEDALAAEAAVDELHSLIDVWPWADPGVYREPTRDRAGAVWNPLDDPRIPAYTLTVRVTIVST